MKLYVPVMMIVVGGLLILGPIAAHECSQERSRDQVAEFYFHNSNAAVLPEAMQSNYGAYDFVCLIVGVGTLGLGIISAGVDYFGIAAAIREIIAQR
ncbi:MAG TPA: hypothetical protein VFE46_17705 [Pirellulales bacterium]|nr:hypothetical protein [Pirellulales bacterium]